MHIQVGPVTWEPPADILTVIALLARLIRQREPQVSAEQAQERAIAAVYGALQQGKP